MIVPATEFLGQGLYTLPEAAFLARVRTRLFSRWLFGDGKGNSVIAPQYKDPDEKLISFLNFVEALTIRSIRVFHPRVPLQRIREAYDEAQARYGVTHPFARKHTTFLLGESKTIVIRLKDDDYRELAGPSRGSRMITQVVETHLHELTFSGELAVEYCAWPPQGQPDATRIVMNPKRAFGEPVLTSSGYTAQTLWEASETEGGTDAAARSFGIDRQEVELACQYYDHLCGTSMA